jgi:hypothetical protein
LSHEIAFERPLFDPSRDPLPVRDVGRVLLDERLESKSRGGVPQLDLPQMLEATLDVLPLHLRFHLFDSHEILLVQRAQPIEARVEFVEKDLDLVLLGQRVRSLVEIYRGVITRLSK